MNPNNSKLYKCLTRSIVTVVADALTWAWPKKRSCCMGLVKYLFTNDILLLALDVSAAVINFCSADLLTTFVD